MAKAAGIYVRISRDESGQRAGVKRQLADTRALCEAKKWPVAKVYEDNDQGAWAGKARPAYQEMLNDIRIGTIDAVVVWHLDRLTRHPKELEEFFDVTDGADVSEFGSCSGDIDLSNPDGQFTARVLSSVARKESDDKSRRIRRKAEEIAKAGRVGGGGTRPFGYNDDRMTVRADEAALIREAAKRVLQGEAIGGIIRDWTARGVKTVTTKPWRTTVLRNLLISPRIAGLRQHQGEVIGPAVWEGIIDESTHRQLVAILTDPSRRTARRTRRYLLTGGLARCGECGAALVARPRDDGRRRYICAKGPNYIGCGHTYILTQFLDDQVQEEVFAVLDDPGLLEALNAAEDDTDMTTIFDDIRADEAALEQLATDHYASQLITRPEFLAARDVIEHRLIGNRARLAVNTSHRVLIDLPTSQDTLQEAWNQADVSWRRALIGSVVESVVVHRGVRGRNFHDPSRVDIQWRV